MLHPDHAPRLVAHLERHLAENGDGGFYFMAPQSLPELLATYDARLWYSAPSESIWQRVWGWCDEDGELRAHCVVTSTAPRTPHRCQLAAGVEAPWRRRGLARALMSEALAWVRSQPSLAWVDGWAFGHNTPVLKLDRQLGFVEIGRMRDVIRVDGRSLDQIFMTVELGGA
jgi:RimJ/RimL family protein N-acetyltransferase